MTIEDFKTYVKTRFIHHVPVAALAFSMIAASAQGQQNETIMSKKNMSENGTHAIDASPSTMECLNPDKQSRMCAKQPLSADGIVRLSKIEVYPQFLDEYINYAVEVGEVSLRTEPGVLTMYAVSEKENPCMITILETYANREAYEAHIQSTHFQKYKQETLHMVKSLVLSDQMPLNPANRINNFIQ